MSYDHHLFKGLAKYNKIIVLLSVCNRETETATPCIEVMYSMTFMPATLSWYISGTLRRDLQVSACMQRIFIVQHIDQMTPVSNGIY